MRICDELRNDSGFGEDLTIVGEARDEAALLFLAPTTFYVSREQLTYRVDLEIPGFTRPSDVNNHFLVVEAGFLKGNVCTVCPRAPMVSVQNDLGGCHTVQSMLYMVQLCTA